MSREEDHALKDIWQFKSGSSLSFLLLMWHIAEVDRLHVKRNRIVKSIFLIINYLR
jgi:hypothetical protein